mmetsp:Transcript_5056/g.12027  ORF Transcript_5056/g.12027 Transcript_5056/m.12027 type:complete len:670 (-) Transcript_5056:315-2324(-)
MADLYRHAKTGDWFQARPQLENTYDEDPTLQAMLKQVLPEATLTAVTSELKSFGHRCAGEIAKAGRLCEISEPVLEQYDGWGERVDNIRTCESWQNMKGIAAEEGIIATAYERKHGEYSRILQAVKLLMFAPSSGLYSCPLAMTDGAAKLFETLLINQGKKGGVTPEAAAEIKKAFARLTSRDPKQFITSGQWMTERRGGSDVANGTDTYAVAEASPNADAVTHRLYGYKWFTSATDADMSIALARPIPASGEKPARGNKTLSAFFLWTRDDKGKLNNITVEKLKKKLGTKQLPTAELLLDGARAIQLCEVGQGIQQIMILANLTRLHNAVGSAAGMRRMVMLCRDYSTRRTIFGRPLCEDALHVHTLARMEVETRGAQAMVLEVAGLLGRVEVPRSAQDAKLAGDLLRIYTPLAKLVTGKMAVDVASEGVESFGGAGYLEDTDIPRMLRDAQVLPIWEGTTNVNALDVFRSVQRSGGQTLATLLADGRAKLNAAGNAGADLIAIPQTLRALEVCERFATVFFGPGGLGSSTSGAFVARDFAMLLGRTAVSWLLIAQSTGSGRRSDLVAAERWAATLEQQGLIKSLEAVTEVSGAGSSPKKVVESKSSSSSSSTDKASPLLSPVFLSGAVAKRPDQIRFEDLLLVYEGWAKTPQKVAEALGEKAPKASL